MRSKLPTHCVCAINLSLHRKRTYKEKLKLWGFEKNVPARDMRLIVAMVEKRKREEGKETRVYFKDRLVEPKKMERFKKRKLAPHNPEEDNLSACE